MKKIHTFTSMAAAALMIAGSAFAANGPVTATGKVEVKDKVSSIIVTEAKGLDGKVQADMAGKALKVVGAKAADAEKLAGKEVEVKGAVKATDIDVTSITEKAAPAAPATPAPATPAPAAPAAPTPAPATK